MAEPDTSEHVNQLWKFAGYAISLVTGAGWVRAKQKAQSADDLGPILLEQRRRLDTMGQELAAVRRQAIAMEGRISEQDEKLEKSERITRQLLREHKREILQAIVDMTEQRELKKALGEL